MRRSYAILCLALVYLLLAACGSTSTRTSAAATSTTTLAPSPSPGLTPLTTVTPEQGCPRNQGGGSVYHFGDLYVAISLTNISYPAAKLPDGVPLKPFNLGPISDPYRGLPQLPKINPELEHLGFFVEVCNGSKSASHRIEGVDVRIDGFVPFTGDLNSWQFCAGDYTNGSVRGGGCGGGFEAGETLHATFDAHAGAGATASAAFVLAGYENGAPLPPLPLTRAPGQDVLLVVSLTAPTTLGYYRFSFSVGVDGAHLPFAPLADELLLGPARVWSGEACLKPEMQSQIPTGSADSYICPNSTT